MGTRMKVERGVSSKGEKKAAELCKIFVFKTTYSAPWRAVEPRITAFVSVPAVSDIAEKGASISHHSAPSRFNIGIIDIRVSASEWVVATATAREIERTLTDGEFSPIFPRHHVSSGPGAPKQQVMSGSPSLCETMKGPNATTLALCLLGRRRT